VYIYVYYIKYRLDLKLQKANEYLKFLSEKKDEPSKNETIKSPYEIKENVSSNENIVENMSSKDEKQQI